MYWTTAYLALLVTLSLGLTDASQYSRDESSEDAKTEFNLASTLTGGISSNRHHARAHLDSQLGPQISQQPFRQPSADYGYGSADIDAPAAHETGGSGMGTLDGRLNPGGNRIGGPASLYPALPIEGQPQHPVGYSIGSSAPQLPYPTAVVYPPIRFTNPKSGQPAGYPVAQPGLTYPGQYLPQYPAYPTYPAYPGYIPVQPGNVPLVVHPVQPSSAPTSYQNQQQFTSNQAPKQRDHWNRSFSMNTEYKEDGVHKGPFDVLNNHNRQGYGSGFGGGYNGAFNAPGY